MTTTAEPTTTPSEVGRARVRKEDARLITGRTRWTDNIVLPGMLHLAVVRSPIAHAKIGAVDVEAARSAPGVVAVLTGRDLADSVLRLTAAIDEIRAAHAVLTRGDATIGDEVSQVREDARRVLVIGDGLARTVEQLATEARELEAEVFRFKLPQARTGGTLRR